MRLRQTGVGGAGKHGADADLLKSRAPAEKVCGSGGTPSRIRRPFVCITTAWLIVLPEGRE